MKNKETIKNPCLDIPGPRRSISYYDGLDRIQLITLIEQLRQELERKDQNGPR